MMLLFFVWDSVFKKYHYVDGDGFSLVVLSFFVATYCLGKYVKCPWLWLGLL